MELKKEQSALEKYQIAAEDTPWFNIKEQGVDFDDYREKIMDQYEKEKVNATREHTRLGDLVKDRIDKAQDAEDSINKTDEERDRQLFDDYLKKGLVNIKNLVLKNPQHRTDKENEFLILYMRHQFECFYDIDKSCIEMFVQRLSFDVYKPGDIVGRTGQPCAKLVMFIDGEIEAHSMIYNVRDSAASSSGPQEGLIRTFKPGTCIGEECFEVEDFKLPFNLICKKRAMTLNLKRKDFAEVLLFQKQ